MAQQKKSRRPEAQNSNQPRINKRIRSKEVRVIDPDNEQLGILSIEDALEQAEQFGLDLVEVAPKAVPPVCRIMDFGKFKYQQSKRASDARKKGARVEVKEIKLRPKTDDHDLHTKLRHARRFLESNNKVKISIMFRGREISHPEIGRAMLDRSAQILKDVSEIEQTPRMEGRNNMVMLLTFSSTPTKEKQEPKEEAQAAQDPAES